MKTGGCFKRVSSNSFQKRMQANFCLSACAFTPTPPMDISSSIGTQDMSRSGVHILVSHDSRDFKQQQILAHAIVCPLCIMAPCPFLLSPVHHAGHPVLSLLGSRLQDVQRVSCSTCLSAFAGT